MVSADQPALGVVGGQVCALPFVDARIDARPEVVSPQLGTKPGKAGEEGVCRMHSLRKAACSEGLLPRNRRRNWITITAGSSVLAFRRTVSRKTNGAVWSWNLRRTPTHSLGEARAPLASRLLHALALRAKSPSAANRRSAIRHRRYSKRCRPGSASASSPNSGPQVLELAYLHHEVDGLPQETDRPHNRSRAPAVPRTSDQTSAATRGWPQMEAPDPVNVLGVVPSQDQRPPRLQNGHNKLARATGCPG
jgi:hypothetical protein